MGPWRLDGAGAFFYAATMTTQPIPPSVYVATVTLSAGTTTATGRSVPVASVGKRAFSLTTAANKDVGTSQTLAATIDYQATNDERGNPAHPDHANADWSSITAALTDGTAANPTGVASEKLNIVIDNVRFGWMRAVVSRTAGDGDFTAHVQVS